MNDYFYYFSIYSFFNRKPVLFLKILIFLFFIFVLLSTFQNAAVAKFVFLIFTLFLINEIFLMFKVNRTKPAMKTSEADKASLEMMTFPALFIYSDSRDAYDTVRNMLREPEIRFIMERTSEKFNLSEDSFDKKVLLEKAYELARAMNNPYIREMDLFVAYILLTEQKSKLLEQNDLKEDDIINILYWARHKFVPKKEGFWDIKFSGSGVFDFFIFGWNVEMKKYSNDFTMKVLSERYSPIAVGRNKEYEQFTGYLAKENGNSVILIGEPGTGKTTMVEYLTFKSHMGDVPGGLAYKRVFELFADRLLSGANAQGELEERIGYLLEDIYHAGNTIVFIQNIENVFGGGGFNFDMSGVIFEYLKNSKIQIIGTTTSSVYKTKLENRDDIKQFFEVVKFEEPPVKDALFMLFEKVPQIEDKYNVSFTYGAIEQAVVLSSSYLIDRYLPGKAIDLLETVASDARNSKKFTIDSEDVIAKLEQKTRVVIGNPTEKEKQVLLHLEEEIHKRIIDQQEAVSAVANSIRRLRSGFSNNKRPISVFLFLGPTGVGKTEMAKALAATYFGDETRMIRLDMSEYQTQESIKRLLGSMPGEAYSPSPFLDAVKNNPFSLVLLDEFEKAHPRILDVFLQVFDDGRLTDNSGKTIPFTNTIIIATSNAGSEIVRQKVRTGIDLQQIKGELIDQLLKEEKFRPELLNRFDDIIVFKPLGQNEIYSIAKLQLFSALKLMEEKSIYINYDEKIIQKISKEAFNAEFGARNVRRYIQEHVENVISTMILSNTLKKGDKKMLTVDDQGKIIVV
jgi:ATP-dependent Clp protease ATP-binding subunit ClpC